MAEIRTVTTLRRKRDEIRRAIRNYERKLDQARANLTHLIAAIAIFEAKGGDDSLPAYADLHRLFRYGEAFKFCQQALASGSKTTRELAVYVYVANAKGLDGGDAVNCLTPINIEHAISGMSALGVDYCPLCIQ